MSLIHHEGEISTFIMSNETNQKAKDKFTLNFFTVQTKLLISIVAFLSVSTIILVIVSLSKLPRSHTYVMHQAPQRSLIGLLHFALPWIHRLLRPCLHRLQRGQHILVEVVALVGHRLHHQLEVDLAARVADDVVGHRLYHQLEVDLAARVADDVVGHHLYRNREQNKDLPQL